MKKLIIVSLWFLLALPIMVAIGAQVTQTINNGGALPGTSYQYQMGQGPSGQISNTAVVDYATGANGQTVSGGSAQVQGQAAAGSIVTGNPVRGGCRAQNVENTPVTNGQTAEEACDLAGKRITSPFANKENWVSGSSGQVAGTTQTTIIASPGVGVKLYITGIQCGNTGGTTDIITFNDAATSLLINPNGGGNNPPLATPLVVAANTAFKMTPSATSTNQFCNAQGYSGS